jgi:hypothetical protein
MAMRHAAAIVLRSGAIACAVPDIAPDGTRSARLLRVIARVACAAPALANGGL